MLAYAMIRKALQAIRLLPVAIVSTCLFGLPAIARSATSPANQALARMMLVR
jgi:hypothetical protein